MTQPPDQADLHDELRAQISRYGLTRVLDGLSHVVDEMFAEGGHATLAQVTMAIERARHASEAL